MDGVLLFPSKELAQAASAVSLPLPALPLILAPDWRSHFFQDISILLITALLPESWAAAMSMEVPDGWQHCLVLCLCSSGHCQDEEYFSLCDTVKHILISTRQ